MSSYRFPLSFIISILLHAVLIALLLFLQHSNNARGFKKGIGENPRIKISSFEIADFDSQANLPSNPLPQSSQSSKKSKTNDKDDEEKRPKPQKKSTQKDKPSPQKTPQNAQDDEEKNKNLPPNPSIQETLQQNQGNFNQPNPQIPIEQTLSYQLADAQTKKNISEFYGAEFGQLGLEEQEYILNNLALIGRITQSYLHYPPNAGMLAQSGGNVVEFYLHPNGDISDLKVIKKSGFLLLDRNSIKTIEIAYKDYPRPKSKTLIRFYINYYLRYK